ncbi:MAG TPA: hypothetical protein VK506_07695 [Conexibacter sp.]|nr:hypothetical protein [Conexibacter sp.]
MTAPRLPEAEELAERLADEIVGHEPGTAAAWQVDGPATAGKSALLRRLSQMLDERACVPLVVAPPAGALDAGPLVLMEIAAGMKSSGLRNGETDMLRDGQRPLSEKVAQVRQWVSDTRDKVVLLYDEPLAWPSRSEQTEHFADHARLVIQELVRDVGCRRVITGDAPGGMRFVSEDRIGTTSEPEAFLDDRDAWGALRDPAAQLASLGVDVLRPYSPLQLRLLVAQVALRSLEEVSAWLEANPHSRRAISQRLIEELSARREHRDLVRAWVRLAYIRRPFDEELLRRIAGRLGRLSKALLRTCLLYRADGQYVLHETLRRDALEAWRNEGMGPDPAITQYRLLAEYYESACESSERHGSGDALLTGMESCYYAARSGMRELVKQRAYFVDQLDLLGKTLSYELKDYAAAAEVFAASVAIDDRDDYAHHYLAYNLDRLGRESERVEHHYARAVELNGQHAWWRARFVQYLVTRGRTTQARNEWDRALDELKSSDRVESVAFHELLHGWVADTLLRRGLLDFAEDVLRDVPQAVRVDSPRITALVQRLRALQIAEREGAYVPGQHLTTDWWMQGPFLLQRRVPPSLTLRRWLAGRIEHLDEHEVEMRVREVEVGAATPPPSASLRIPAERFDELSRDWSAAELEVGRFVEIGLYSNEDDGHVTLRQIRVHPHREWRDETLPMQRAAGDRYWIDKIEAG